jgi:hypothetical protein
MPCLLPQKGVRVPSHTAWSMIIDHELGNIAFNSSVSQINAHTKQGGFKVSS